MVKTYTLTNVEGIKAMLPDLFRYLANMKKDWTMPRLFINGEFDSHQSTYEWLSTQGRIGVLAHSKEVGYILLFLLRLIIDKQVETRFLDVFTEEFEAGHHEITYNDPPFETRPKGTLTMSEITQYLAGYETAYTTIYELDKPMVIKLCGCDLHVDLDFIDIWTLARIRAEFLGFTPEDIRKGRDNVESDDDYETDSDDDAVPAKE